jgi:tRNA G18 (ribose-2'-O)-methylase SpoU
LALPSHHDRCPVDNVNVIPIDSLDDERLEFFTHLTDVELRRTMEPDTGLYIAESSKVIERALRAGHQPRAVITTEKWLTGLEHLLDEYDVEVFVGDEGVLEQITGFHLHRGALASMERPPLRTVAETIAGASLVVVLDNIIDHTNVGAIFRSVAGLGADAVLITPDCADPLYRRSVRVSMGTVLQVPWTRIPDWPTGISELQAAGFTVVALALSDESVTLREFAVTSPDKVAVVFGSEGHGLDRRTIERCDAVVRIPMGHGVDSLNVAAASAVTLYALSDAMRR